MGGAPLLLALAIITADVGWESDGRAGYRYIIQVSPAQMAELQRDGSVTSQIPVELQRRVTSVVLRVGNDPLPQPEIVLNPSSDPIALSNDLSLKTAYPAPPDTSTVRAQSGESGGFAMPTLNDVRESGQQALEELKNEGSAQLSEAARQTSDQLKSSLTAFIQNGNAPSTSPAANTTPGFGMPSTAGAISGAGGGTTAPGGMAVPSNAAAPSTSRNPNAGQTAADANAANGWSGYQPRTAPSTAPVNAANVAPLVSAPPTAAPSTSASGSGYGTGASNAYTPRTGITGSPNDPPSAFNASMNANMAAPYTPPASIGSGTGYTTPGYVPPSVTNPGLGIPSAVDATGYGANGIAPVKLTPEQQEIADQQLLAQIGFDQDFKAYDKQTGRLILDTDPRAPHIREYINRTNEKILLKRREQEYLAAATAAANTNANVFDRNAQAQRAANTISAPNWGATPDDRYAQSNLYAPGGGYLPNGYNSGSLANTGSSQQATNGQGSKESTVGDQNAGSNNSKSANETTGTGSTKSASDELERNREDLKKSVRDITPQPVYNFMLIISVVVNVYLGIAISRLLRRYRNLIATHRGTTLSV